MSEIPDPHTRSTGRPAPATTEPHRATRRGRRTLAAALALAASALIAGCSAGAPGADQGAADPGAADPAAAAAPADAAATAGPAVKLGQTSLGRVLVGPEGLTLYGFANDRDGASTCSGTCADAWPPLIVSPDWVPGPELDSGIFATTTRDDGSLQLVAGKWPLYYYASDSAPGDVTGQGSGSVWFVVDGTGSLVKTAAGPGGTAPANDAAAAGGSAAGGSGAVRTTSSPLGTILVDGEGRTLYGFTKDANGTPTCEGACANAWPAVIVDGGRLPTGLDPAVFTVVARPDGKSQLKAGKWPLYRFSGDSSPGDVNGQGSGGVWFVVDSKGALIKGTGGTASTPTTTTTRSASNGPAGY